MKHRSIAVMKSLRSRKLHCKACEREVPNLENIINTFRMVLCDDCKANGGGWTLVYDRASGTGSIPANLLKEYGNGV